MRLNAVVNWPISRLLLSNGANVYARRVTGLPLWDATGGFKCFRRHVLEAIDLDDVRSNGYAFQIEMSFRAWKKGFRIVETPIVRPWCSRIHSCVPVRSSTPDRASSARRGSVWATPGDTRQ